jgi:hypothetical protein
MSEQYDALALWVAHTWAFTAADTTPYLHITAPTMAAGKTRVLEVLNVLVQTGWFTAGTTAANLYRRIDAMMVTALIDEGDNLLAHEPEFRAALNGVLSAGYRRGGVYSVAVHSNGQDWQSRDFSVFCPKAIAGIGRPPETLASRTIRIDMRPVRRTSRSRGSTLAARGPRPRRPARDGPSGRRSPSTSCAGTTPSPWRS